jgi:hypothetical protein
MNLTLITESLSRNSLGRTYCLWLLAQELGWDAAVISTAGEELWSPLRGTAFASATKRIEVRDIEREVGATDLIIACKPLPDSLGHALTLTRRLHIPLLLDIDDPDLEVRTRAGQPALAALRWVRRPRRSIVDVRHRAVAKSIPTIVSNPWLAARYGGDVIPHVRPPMQPGSTTDSSDLHIVFAGTNHAHKGVPELRAAVSLAQSKLAATTLTVTDVPPTDARAWERWVGTTTLAEGLNLARHADAVVLPSRPGRHATGQLPVKLIDAMMLGRPVVVSDVDPLPWAVDDAGLVVKAGDRAELTNALESLRDPALRAELGRRAAHHAMNTFSVEAVAPTFAVACRKAIGSN